MQKEQVVLPEGWALRPEMPPQADEVERKVIEMENKYYLDLYKRMGINLIPAQQKSKLPALGQWKEYQSRQSTDEEREKWFCPGSLHNWIGICGKVSGNLIVIDFDKGDNYHKFFSKADELEKKTLVVKTNRGYHVYLRTKDPVKSFKVPELGIDIQGEGKYVILSPSIHPDSGKPYEIISESKDIMSVDDFETGFEKQIKELGVIRREYVPEIQTNGTTISIKRELPKIIMDVIAAGTKTQRNNMRWRIFTTARKFGWPNDDILPLLLEYNRNSFEPWPDQEIKKHWEKMCQDFIKYKDIYEQERKKGFEPRVLGDAEINAMNIQPPKWIVESLVPEKSIIIWGGKRGSFKTFCTLHLGMCVANGKPVFGKYKTEQCNVLYVDEENGLHLLKPRLDKLKNSLRIQDHKMNFCVYENFKLDNPDKFKCLQEIVLEHGIKLIIVDSMRRVMNGDENDADEINQFFMEGVRPLIECHGLSIILLHHMRKGNNNKGGKDVDDEMDELRGSSDIANFADLVYVTNRPRGADNKFILKQVKNRYNMELPGMLVELGVSDTGADFVWRGEAIDILAEQVVANAILGWLAEQNITEFQRVDIMNRKGSIGASERTIDEALKVLMKQGKVRKLKKGHYLFDAKQEPLAT